MQGFLLIDKPAGMTSHDVIDSVRELTGIRKVGHAGTLDPFATGLLIIGVGRPATREMQNLVGLDKKYEAVFVLGASSTTDDVEGDIKVTPHNNYTLLSHKKDESDNLWREEVEKALTKFIGKIDQVPPSYSAIKIKGKKMYEEARKGNTVDIPARRVHIHQIDLISTNFDSPMPKISVSIHCASGTYIRAIARDLGRALGCGGYVEKLRRTDIGPFSISEAKRLDELTPTTLPLKPVKNILNRL